MTYLLILFVLVVAIAPLLSMAPGKRQRRIAGLRQYAQSKGLVVTLAIPPKLPPRLVPTPNTQQLACYTRRYSLEEKRKPAKPFSLLRLDDDWYTDSGSLAGTAEVDLLGDLPADVPAVVVDRQGCSVYWGETGTVAEIDRIVVAMELILSSRK